MIPAKRGAALALVVQADRDACSTLASRATLPFYPPAFR
jgi:hypothetical protein